MAKAKPKKKAAKKKGVATEIATKIGMEIDKEIEKEKCGEDKFKAFTKGKSGGGSSGAVYGLGMIGAAVYFIQHAGGFWMGVLGLLKALVWPAILVYELLGKVI